MQRPSEKRNNVFSDGLFFRFAETCRNRSVSRFQTASNHMDGGGNTSGRLKNKTAGSFAAAENCPPPANGL